MIPTLPWTPKGKDEDLQQREKPHTGSEYDPILKLLESHAFSATLVSAIVFYGLYHRFGKRVRTADHVTANMLEKRKWIKGRVTSVGDADGFRLYHTPLLWIGSIPTTTKDLKNQTIPIRIAGVDAPEGAYFGRPAQPFAAESHTWLKKKILGKKAYCQLLHRDQYSRIVANVYVGSYFSVGRIFSKNLALDMLRAGCATIYEQASAVYGKEGKDAYLTAEKEAKSRRRGIWKAGTNIETPAEYKRKYSSTGPLPTSNEPSRKVVHSRPRTGLLVTWFRRMWRK